MRRRRFLKCLLAAGVGGAGALAYARYIEPRRLRVVHRRVTLPARCQLDPPLRLVHLSDLHSGADTPRAVIAEAVRRAVAARPDLIFITGDFVTAGRRTDLAALARLLAPLAEAAPVFATFGNHDGGPFTVEFGGYLHTGVLREALAPARLRFLENAHEMIELHGRRLHVVGLGDLWNGACRPERAFAGWPPPAPDEPVIAATHNPDARRFLREAPWDLLLCGHTHGGQCGLPWIGRRFSPVEDKSFIAGLRDEGGRWVHITRGVGTLHKLRFLCPPEIAVLEVG